MKKIKLFIFFIIIWVLPVSIVNNFNAYPYGYDYEFINSYSTEIQVLDPLGKVKETYVTETWGNIGTEKNPISIRPQGTISDIKDWYIQMASVIGFFLALLFLFIVPKKDVKNKKKFNTVTGALLLVSIVLIISNTTILYPTQEISDLNEFIQRYQITTE